MFITLFLDFFGYYILLACIYLQLQYFIIIQYSFTLNSTTNKTNIPGDYSKDKTLNYKHSQNHIEAEVIIRVRRFRYSAPGQSHLSNLKFGNDAGCNSKASVWQKACSSLLRPVVINNSSANTLSLSGVTKKKGLLLIPLLTLSDKKTEPHQKGNSKPLKEKIKGNVWQSVQRTNFLILGLNQGQLNFTYMYKY